MNKFGLTFLLVIGLSVAAIAKEKLVIASDINTNIEPIVELQLVDVIDNSIPTTTQNLSSDSSKDILTKIVSSQSSVENSEAVTNSLGKAITHTLSAVDAQKNDVFLLPVDTKSGSMLGRIKLDALAALNNGDTNTFNKFITEYNKLAATVIARGENFNTNISINGTIRTISIY